MDINNVRNHVLGSSEKDWYDNVEISFPFVGQMGSVKKKGIISILEYIQKQIENFDSFEKDIPAELNNTKEYLISLQAEIFNIIKSNYQNKNQLDSTWNKVKVKNRDQRVVLINPISPEALFLTELHSINSAWVRGAVLYFSGQDIPNDKIGFVGALKAYEFTMHEESKNSIEESKKSTLSKLSMNIEDALDQAEKLLLDHLKRTKSSADDFSSEIVELKKQKDKLFTDWFSQSQQEFKNLSENIETKRKELEKTYGEIFFLKEPAKYWKDRAVELGLDGRKYLSGIFFLVGTGIISHLFLLWFIPDGLLLDIFSQGARAIKWTIVYLTFISFFAVGIRTFSKLAYSTYHLKRDAEERHQLTYVYLSLVNDKKIDEKERQLVLQSLFSRADTGLLKDDSSPAMPGLIESVFRTGKN